MTVWKIEQLTQDYMIKFCIIIIAMLLLLKNIKKGELISSSSLWIFCYSVIFVVYPIVSEFKCSNSTLIDVCALLGILSFMVGVSCGKNIKINENKSRFINSDGLYPKLSVAVVMYIFITVLSLVVLYRSIGITGIRSILSGSATIKQMTIGSGKTLSSLYGFLQQLLMACILIIWTQSETRFELFLRILCLAIYIVQNFLFTFTRLFMISCIVIIIFYELRKFNAKKQVIFSSLSIIAIVMIMVTTNFTRNLGVSGGLSIDYLFDIGNILEGTDFGAAYKYFSQLLKCDLPLIIPWAYLKPLFCFVPRSFWRMKPDTLNVTIMEYINPALASSGFSAGTSVLGEGYAVLGYLGIIVYPFLWGAICSYLDKKYYKNIKEGKDKTLAILYYYIFAVLIVISGQRGDWSTYFVNVVWFFIVPLWLMAKISFKRNK